MTDILDNALRFPEYRRSETLLVYEWEAKRLGATAAQIEAALASPQPLPTHWPKVAPTWQVIPRKIPA